MGQAPATTTTQHNNEVKHVRAIGPETPSYTIISLGIMSESFETENKIRPLVMIPISYKTNLLSFPFLCTSPDNCKTNTFFAK
jgi:hypothetical protein